MNETRLGTDRVTLALEFTPLIGQCPSGCNKCRRALDSKVPKQARPQIATPEERERIRALYEKRFPAPPPEVSETLGSTFAFEKPQPEGEQEQGPSTTEVIENARRLHRAHESHNETVKVCQDAEAARAGYVCALKLVKESKDHQAEIREEAKAKERARRARLRGGE
ncbi:MAG: hypothetical protein ABSB28_08635 [Candidatus Bathyarchaeia archaeon]